MFITARNKAGFSREEAAFRLHIGTRTLNNYEHHQTIVPPDIALDMQQIYQEPSLTARYCSDYCPIGQVFSHTVSGDPNLCSAVLGILKEQNDFSKIREKLVEITADGVIDQDELPEFENIMDELLDLEQRIEEFKLAAASRISIQMLMQKRKRPLEAAIK